LLRSRLLLLLPLPLWCVACHDYLAPTDAAPAGWRSRSPPNTAAGGGSWRIVSAGTPRWQRSSTWCPRESPWPIRGPDRPRKVSVATPRSGLAAGRALRLRREGV